MKVNLRRESASYRPDRRFFLRSSALHAALIGAGMFALTNQSLPAAWAQDEMMAGYGDISSSGSGTDAFSGVNINTFVGANRFYSAGYTGTSTIIANVEGGLIWDGHATLTQDTTQIYSPMTSSDFDFHATWVGNVLNGRAPASPEPSGYYDTGIATGATVWSGAVASSFVGGGSTSFNFSTYRAAYAYYNAMTPATMGGAKADVVNSSWGYSDPGGSKPLTQFVDALIYQTGETFVAASGDNGYGTNAVTGMASGYNSISVGGTASDTDTNPYQRVGSYSSGGPSDYYNNTGTKVNGAQRARVDIVAPGQDFTLANYQGSTGGNTGVASPSAGVTPAGGSTSTDSFITNLQGTSFSAPTVAGGASLLIDAGKSVYSTNTNAIDGRVIKSVLLNSADKLAGFNNGTAVQAGTGALVTTQALDYSQGAGQLNLSRAYDQYLSGDHDVTLTAGAATISNLGWDYDSVAVGSSNNYTFGTSLNAGDVLTATLNWFVADSYTYTTASRTSYPSNVTEATDRFDNLYLSLYQVVSPGTYQLVAESAADYITTQQIFLTIPTTGTYFLQVNDHGQQYDDGTITGNTTYGLAWNSLSAPEPGAAILLIGAAPLAFGLLRVSRRRLRRPVA